jgi:hypothetical protein
LKFILSKIFGSGSTQWALDGIPHITSCVQCKMRSTQWSLWVICSYFLIMEGASLISIRLKISYCLKTTLSIPRSDVARNELEGAQPSLQLFPGYATHDKCNPIFSFTTRYLTKHQKLSNEIVINILLSSWRWQFPILFTLYKSLND